MLVGWVGWRAGWWGWAWCRDGWRAGEAKKQEVDGFLGLPVGGGCSFDDLEVSSEIRAPFGRLLRRRLRYPARGRACIVAGF